ncbi:MAG: hypothetical protein KDA60_09890 [Planctomycetales bacterium]|nr:hypothetical protein [Planctomycetales bacterium]
MEIILDEARQNGTRPWTPQEAMSLHVPTPTIDTAVSMGDLSVLKDQRIAVGAVLSRANQRYGGNHESLLYHLQEALFVGMAVTYAQGFALLRVASEQYQYGLQLSDVARVWRSGCTVSSQLLEDIRSALLHHDDLANLVLAPQLAERIKTQHEGLRSAVHSAAAIGIPVPGLMISLAYLDALRSPWLPANLIQSQRDYFGAHTFERADRNGVLNTQGESHLAYAPIENATP